MRKPPGPRLMLEILKNVFQSFRVADLFDILFIAGLIYAVWMWFSVTTSRFVLMGIALMGIIYIVSRSLQMYLTALVLQGFFTVLVVALVVIFQEEIRRFFERIATWKGFSDIKGEFSPDSSIQIICQTATRLAERKIGAIMVVQGKDPIGRHLSGGVSLSGELSAAILESIFDPHSVGHDGAVVIDRGRLSRFACQLPLSSRAKEFGLMGLRHTAALGLSEVCDALCVVVSEERGCISIARDGNIERLENPNILADILNSYCAALVPRKKGHRFTGWFRQNFRTKAMSLGLAMVLWLVFGLQRDVVSREFVFPIEYRNLASDWVIESSSATEAQVYLSGPRQAFALLDTSALKISVDLSDVEEGEQKLVLSRSLLKIPTSLSIENMKPGVLTLSAYRLRPTRVPVEVELAGSLPNGLRLVSVTAAPDGVTVLAPKKGKKRSKISTDPIDLSRIRETTSVEPSLQVPADMRFAGGKAPVVMVTIRVKKVQNGSGNDPNGG